MKLPPFDYACPATLSEAVALLASHDGDAKALAGGQSLVPMLAFRLAQPALLVDLRKLPDLRQIKISNDGVALGAMARWRDIEDDTRLRTAHPLLVAAISHVAHYQIRNRGTVGGSIAHADPAAEMPGIAVTCDAAIAVVGTAGARVISAADFFEGALVTALKPDEKGLSRQHVAVGDIIYPGGHRGILLLFKPTIVGDEPGEREHVGVGSDCKKSPA
jgi:carbon-monoxide dehydrogenase medium subunit